LYFFVVYFCGIWAFSSSRKHLLIALLRLEFVVLVLYFSIYFYLCSFNYSLFFVAYNTKHTKVKTFHLLKIDLIELKKFIKLQIGVNFPFANLPHDKAYLAMVY
jgi:hypothetical protein